MTTAAPPITTLTAIGLLTIYALIYVIPFYLRASTRPSATRSRDEPAVIQARIASVCVTCLICSCITFLVLIGAFNGDGDGAGYLSWRDAVHALGYWPIGIVDSLRMIGLTMLLFLGPLFEVLVAEEGWRSWVVGEPLRALWVDWMAWRNYVAGPVTEEILFRSAGVPLMLLANASLTQTLILSPLVFGLGHVHHFYERRLTRPDIPLLPSLAMTVFQLGFTSLFGAYATFLFLRTGSLLGVCCVHAFCNSMGLPRVWGRVAPYTAKSVGRTAAYYVLLITGAVLWWQNLWSLTDSAAALMALK